MKIVLEPQPDSSLTEKLDITLGDYTILAGENNAGKTNIVKAIIEQKNDIESLKEYKIIRIEAERIQPSNETGTSRKTSNFYEELKGILVPIFGEDNFSGLIKKFNNSPKKKTFVKEVNDILDGFGVEKKKFNVQLTEDAIAEDVIIRVIKPYAEDHWLPKPISVNLDSIGMGTQRMLVVALIQYYESKKIKDGMKRIFIIEEPELYLHPRLKRSFHQTLKKLAEHEDTLVLITTHDPYFIELGQGQTIHRVSRNKGGATVIESDIGNDLLRYISPAEINYLIFGIPSPTYFLELYERLHGTFKKTNYKCQQVGCSGELRCETCKEPSKGRPQRLLDSWVKDQYAKGKVPNLSETRNKIGHPEEGAITDDEILDGIKELSKLVKARDSKLQKNG